MFYFNGKILPDEHVSIDPRDRGFLLSDGLFETMRAYGGKIFCLREHWERLESSAATLGIPLPITFEALKQATHELLEAQDLLDKDASLRLTLTCGTGPRGLLPPNPPTPTLMITASLLNPKPFHSINAVVVTSTKRNEYSPLSKIKSLNYLDNIIARKEAVDKGADEGILLNTKDIVAEATAANVFIVTDRDEILTPRIEDGILPGITRKTVLEICKQLALPIVEKSIKLETLLSAKEIFLTNSIIEINPVLKLNDKNISYGAPGETTKSIFDEYQKMVREVDY